MLGYMVTKAKWEKTCYPLKLKVQIRHNLKLLSDSLWAFHTAWLIQHGLDSCGILGTIKWLRGRTVSKSSLFVNLANFLSISPSQTWFLPYVCLVPVGLFCHFCFNLCSLFNRKTNLAKCKHEEKMQRFQRKGKYILLFLGEVSTSWFRFFIDIGRNFLLGSRKKVAKCLMRTYILAAQPSSMPGTLPNPLSICQEVGYLQVDPSSVN